MIVERFHISEIFVLQLLLLTLVVVIVIHSYGCIDHNFIEAELPVLAPTIVLVDFSSELVNVSSIKVRHFIANIFHFDRPDGSRIYGVGITLLILVFAVAIRSRKDDNLSTV